MRKPVSGARRGRVLRWSIVSGVLLVALGARAEEPAAVEPETRPAESAPSPPTTEPQPALQPAAAQPTPTPAAEPATHRELAGHQFLPSHLVTDPFSVTSFASYFGLITGEALGPEVVWALPPTVEKSKWYGYMGLAQQFDLSVRFIEYLSMHLAFTAGAFQGLGNGSALVVGTNIRAAGAVDLKGSIPVGKHLRFALGFGAKYGPELNVLILQGLVNSINAGDTQDFLESGNVLTWTVRTSGAWAPWAFLGVRLNIDYQNPRKTGSGGYIRNAFRFAGSVEFDAGPLVRWLPIAASVAYNALVPFGGDTTAVGQDFAAGLFYSGRRDVALGVELEWSQGRLANELASRSIVAWIDFRYYW
jgi:hypothetical protein